MRELKKWEKNNKKKAKKNKKAKARNESGGGSLDHLSGFV
jgi:hypothetical protein